MNKASIFQKNISPNGQKDAVESALNINNALVEFTVDKMLVKYENGNLESFHIEFFEEDFITISHLGKFANGIPFRLIQPIGTALQNVKAKYSSLGAFSIGSLSPDGYGIHFVLLEPEVQRHQNPENQSNVEQVQDLVNSAIMAKEFGLDSKFIEFSKRLLAIIQADPTVLAKQSNSQELVQLIKKNLRDFNSGERLIIDHI